MRALVVLIALLSATDALAQFNTGEIAGWDGCCERGAKVIPA